MCILRGTCPSEEVKETFIIQGCSDDWIKEHVFYVGQKKWFDGDRGGWFNDLPEILREKKEEINRWLEQRKSVKGKTIVKTFRNKQFPMGVYSADFVPEKEYAVQSK